MIVSDDRSVRSPLQSIYVAVAWSTLPGHNTAARTSGLRPMCPVGTRRCPIHAAMRASTRGAKACFGACRGHVLWLVLLAPALPTPRPAAATGASALCEFKPGVSGFYDGGRLSTKQVKRVPRI